MKRTVIAVGLVLLSMAGLCGCGRNRELARMIADDKLPPLQKAELVDEDGLPIVSAENNDSANKEVIALADTREEAEEIAELYGIELNTYSYGVATYTTDKNLQELIDLGVENDYPTLTPNYEVELHGESKLHTEQ